MVSTGTTLGRGSAPLAGTRKELAPHMVRAAFSAIGIVPEADVDQLAAVVDDGPAFAKVEAPGAEPEPVAVAEPEPEPEPEPVVDPEPEPAVAPEPEPVAADPEPKPDPLADSGRMTVTRTRPTRPAGAPSLGTAVALGFAPVPGLNSAYLRDMPGFIVSLVGSVALGALSVYTLGATVRWKQPFVASSILVPYAIGVTFNQVSGLVGWNRLYGKRAQAAGFRPNGAALVPLWTVQDGRKARTTGAAFSLTGSW